MGLYAILSICGSSLRMNLIVSYVKCMLFTGKFSLTLSISSSGKTKLISIICGSKERGSQSIVC